MARDGLGFASSPELGEWVRACYAQGRRGGGEGSSNPYALQPDTLGFLSAVLDQLAPRSIVEFGSGESTRLFAAWAAGHGARLTSVEHDRGWVEQIAGRLDGRERAVARVVHVPLWFVRRGLRLFLTYRSLEAVAEEVAGADLFLLDGPHPSGREVVLYHVLSHCRVASTIVIDDANHYSIQDMLRAVPAPLAACFAGESIVDNSHGLYVLRCVRAPTVAASIPAISPRAIARSYWRCLRDFRQHGTGG